MSGSFALLGLHDQNLKAVRGRIREFLAADREEFGWRPAVDSWLSRWDPDFSVRLGEAGLLGLTIPENYGGRGCEHLHRYIVTEELLAQGAPVAAHWVADRQVAPTLLRFGSEEQKARILPQIADGRFYSAIGMSEHGAGSDLAAVKTKATRTEGGWILNGTKVWTSGAHHAHMVVVLARTAPVDPEARHKGFSQFMVSTDAAGVDISPIQLMSGEHHFNEVVLTNVLVPDSEVLGEIGNGWHQVTAELSYERSGPERFLSTIPLLLAVIEWLSTGDVPLSRSITAAVGDLGAQVIALRQLSTAVARALEAGNSPANQAALVKDLGTKFEQDSVDLVSRLLDDVEAETGRAPTPEIAELLRDARLHQALFTLRGGTNEVLRGVVARGLGLR
ncbi:acyl-CoA dehydrogenase family protein [Rhodococcoides yunnanense]|uniref:Acyl-CoA dehydrogenase family protein n=1 Tax=Rhodococcoides yunnanense TaxID=278209 RepID=A0ABU4BKF7_9NOCA|nr:acyl-CoA dehydrogenase family protein [Rhodococcus yunnanensis]MDV6264702.1 acyl-CoA dehydrogenase family protein [Rhodococcus yunnanensis]